MAAETDPEDERSGEPLLDDDSAGPLAELLFSSPVIGADGDSQAGPNRLDGDSLNGLQSDGIDRGGNGRFGGESFGGEHSSAAAVPPLDEEGPTKPTDREPPGGGDVGPDSIGFESSNGHPGRHDFGSISPPVFPGTDSGDIPSIDDVRGVGDLAFEPDTSLSTIHAPDLGDGVADELAALFLPIEPADPVDDVAAAPPSHQPPEESPALPRTEPIPVVPSAPITQSAPITSSAPMRSHPESNDPAPDIEVPVRIEQPPTRASSPVISVPPTEPIPLAEPASSTMSMNDIAGELKYSTEAARPGSLQWSTVVGEPGRSTPEPHAVPTHDRSLFQEPPTTGPGTVFRVEAARPVSLPARSGFVSDSLHAASERRWFWGAVAGAVAVSCLVVGFVLFGLDRDDGTVDADSALAAVDATETDAGRPSAGLSDDQQESPVSAQLTPTSGLPPAAPPGRPPGPPPPRPGLPRPTTGGPVSSTEAPTTVASSTTDPGGSSVTTAAGSSTSNATTTTSSDSTSSTETSTTSGSSTTEDTSTSSTSGSSTTEDTSTSSSVTTSTTSGSSTTEDTSSSTSPSSTPSP